MSSELFEKGLEVRKEVLGEDYGERSLANANGFTMALQKFVTEVAWGKAWSESSLTRKQMSRNNLCMLAARNRAPEFELHFRGALRIGMLRAHLCVARTARVGTGPPLSRHHLQIRGDGLQLLREPRLLSGRGSFGAVPRGRHAGRERREGGAAATGETGGVGRQIDHELAALAHV